MPNSSTSTICMDLDETDLDESRISKCTPMASLRSIKDNQIYSIYHGKNTIGRSADCDICLPSLHVSRHHAVIEIFHQFHFLRHLSTTNSTLRNGLKLLVDTNYEINSGVKLTIGDVDFEYCINPINHHESPEDENINVNSNFLSATLETQEPSEDGDERGLDNDDCMDVNVAVVDDENDNINDCATVPIASTVPADAAATAMTLPSITSPMKMTASFPPTVPINEEMSTVVANDESMQIDTQAPATRTMTTTPSHACTLLVSETPYATENSDEYEELATVKTEAIENLEENVVVQDSLLDETMPTSTACRQSVPMLLETPAVTSNTTVGRKLWNPNCHLLDMSVLQESRNSCDMSLAFTQQTQGLAISFSDVIPSVIMKTKRRASSSNNNAKSETNKKRLSKPIKRKSVTLFISDDEEEEEEKIEKEEKEIKMPLKGRGRRSLSNLTSPQPKPLAQPVPPSPAPTPLSSPIAHNGIENKGKGKKKKEEKIEEKKVKPAASRRIVKKKNSAVEAKENTSSNNENETTAGTSTATISDNVLPPVVKATIKRGRTVQKKKEEEIKSNCSSSLISGPHILFTGLPSDSWEDTITKLGGFVVSEVDEATHIVTDQIRRTLKLMVGLVRCLPIVNVQWLENSVKIGHFVDSASYEFAELKDATIKAKENVGGLLKGWTLFVTPNVKPQPDQLKPLIEACGGKMMTNFSQFNITCKKESNVVIITTQEDLDNKQLARPIKSAFQSASNGNIDILATEFLLSGFMTQTLQRKAHLLTMQKEIVEEVVKVETNKKPIRKRSAAHSSEGNNAGEEQQSVATKRRRK